MSPPFKDWCILIWFDNSNVFFFFYLLVLIIAHFVMVSDKTYLRQRVLKPQCRNVKLTAAMTLTQCEVLGTSIIELGLMKLLLLLLKCKTRWARIFISVTHLLRISRSVLNLSTYCYGTFCTIVTIPSIDLRTVFHGCCIDMTITHPRTKFHMPSFSSSLIIAVKPKAEENFCTSAPYNKSVSFFPPKNFIQPFGGAPTSQIYAFAILLLLIIGD